MIKEGRFVLADVPEFSRVPDFFITTYPNHQIHDYLYKYSMLFDRDFYKNLICSNKKALFVSSNIFEIMPEEYIDTEMVDLAIVSSIGTNSYNWLLAVLNKKPEVLSAEATTGNRDVKADIGANRMLLENHFLYNFIDEKADISDYKLLILPDVAGLSDYYFTPDKLEAYRK